MTTSEDDLGTPKVTTPQRDLVTGTSVRLDKRGITEESCVKWRYIVGTYKDEPCHIAQWVDHGQVVAQKVRLSDKRFTALGDKKAMGLYGRWLWGDKGKSIVITEGELDAISVSQAFGHKWPVVSLPHGAQSAEKVVKLEYEWLMGFDKIVLCFDQDEHGQNATEAVAQLLPVGRAYVMRLNHKDANEVLLKEGPGAITKAYWDAAVWRPDGIKGIEELREEFLNPIRSEGIPWPYPGLQEKLGDIRLTEGALYTITSGSGLGKSTLCKELAYYFLTKHQLPVGGMFLEESNIDTVDHLVCIHTNKNVMVDPTALSDSQRLEAFNYLATLPLYLWDHFGSNDIDVVLAKVRYMVVSLGCRMIILDHLSILVSGIDNGDERKTIDIGMTKLKSLCQELSVNMFLVSHLKRPSGDKGHEEGAPVSAGQLRGSHSIVQLSNVVIGLQKDPEDPTSDNLFPVVLKARRGGRRGPAGCLVYSNETGRLLEGREQSNSKSCDDFDEPLDI